MKQNFDPFDFDPLIDTTDLPTFYKSLREIITDLPQNKRLKDVIYESLQIAIISNIIPVGEIINQNALADYLFISRTTVYTVVKRLKKENMIEKKGNRTVVKRVSIADVSEIFQLRLSLETLALTNAMEVMQPEDFTEIDKLLRKTIHANSEYNVAKVVQYFFDYNRLLFHYAQMPRLEIVVKQLQGYLARFRDISLVSEARRTQAISEHQHIVDCMKTKDTQLVKDALKEHLATSEKFILEQIKLQDASKIDKLFQSIAQKATAALITEVELTPKPGLVDTHNTGSHDDMDLALFLRSANTLTPYFYEYCMAGFIYGFDLAKILPTIRRIGWRAEQNMFVATEGINTHKGANFSFGIFLSSLGAFFRQQTKLTLTPLTWDNIDTLLILTKQICAQLVVNDFAQLDKKTTLSHGEQLYLKYGFAGIRAEVEQGFPSLVQYAFPLLQTPKEGSQDERYLTILLQLMSHVDDSNIIHRGGFKALEYVKTLSRSALLACEKDPTQLETVLLQLDSVFIAKNLSPGGTADLLALAIFIDKLFLFID